MKIFSSTLYLYENVHRLTRKDDPGYFDIKMDNFPMNKRVIKLHKGMDNTITFRVFLPDNKPASVCDTEVYFRLIDHEKRETILERKMVSGAQKGFLSVDIYEGDLSDLDIGLYVAAVVELVDGKFSPLFTDFDNNIRLTVEITDQAERTPLPSVEITENDWTEYKVWNEDEGRDVFYFMSSSIPGNRSANHITSNHSFSVNCDNYSGKLYLYGTLDNTPNPLISRGWFKLEIDGADYLEFIEYTGTRFYNFQSNVMWYRFVHEPAENNRQNLKKIIARS